MKESTSLNLFERLSFHFYLLGNIAKNPFEYRVADQEARAHMNSFLKAIVDGKPSSKPLINERWQIFKEFDTKIQGEQNIPTDQCFITVMNHFKRGRLRGNWVAPVVFEAISRYVDNTQKQRRYRMIITAEKFHPIFRRIMSNLALISDGINSNTMKELPNCIKNKDVIGLFPSGKDELALRKMDPKAGKLFKMLGKREIPILPVGTWFDKKNQIYQVNFGEALIFDRTNKQLSDQTVADVIGIKIANLLPENLQGYYQNITP